MSKVKYEWNFYSCYDHTGIERHLTRMAEKGWLIEKLGWLWRYRRIEPRTLRFSVVYYPESSEFDPAKPDEGELTFWDYCAQAGWVKAANRAQMNVFYHENVNAVPIETDAAMQVETLHRAMRKEQLPSNYLMLAFALWQLIDACKSFSENFAAALATPTTLTRLMDWVLLLPLYLLELGGYYLWRRRAKRAAEVGEFLPTRSHPLLQLLALVLVLTGCGAIILGESRRRTYLAILAGLALLNLLVQGIKRLLKRCGASTAVNKGVTILAALVLSFVFSFTLLRSARDDRFERADKNATPYTVEYPDGDSSTYYTYHDPLPLYVQDLTETGYTDYSCQWHESSTPLASRAAGSQQVREDDRDLTVPRLEYTITDVSFAPLFARCVQSELDYYRNYTVTYYRTFHPFRHYEYRETDAAPWGADRAWQLYDTQDNTELGSWLLTRGTRIVTVTTTNFMPDGLQMQRISAALLG